MTRVILAILAAAILSGCTQRTEYGPCIGAFDDPEPGLHYKLSVWNTVLAVVFFQTIVVPVVVVADQVRCPIAKKGGA